jgi:predicted dehydrogenase
MEKVRVGVIGCGAISGAYFKHAKSFPILEMAACADIVPEAASKRAEEFGIATVCTVDQILADKSIQIVLNLTIPKAHAAVSVAAIEAGKHVYLEKPLGVNREEGRKVVEAARKHKKLVGCAPDTVLGAGIQTARKVLDEGTIGKPVAFTAFMLSPGVETWHPNPEFYYEVGGGPMLDMGPYYVTALLNLLGPVKQISGAARIAIPDRTITHQNRQTGEKGPKYGKKIKVETPDHICGTIEFENGCLGTIMTSFATRFGTYDGKYPITIYGTAGTLKVPDPNGFDGPVAIRKLDDEDWSDVPHAFVTGYGRAVGLADMAYAIKSGRRFRVDGDQAFAVLDLMQGFLDSAASGTVYNPTSKYTRPAPMPAELPFGQLDP